MLSPAMQEYRRLEQQLIRVRALSKGEYSEWEDAIIEGMNQAWSALSDDEIMVLDAEPPQAPNHLAPKP